MKYKARFKIIMIEIANVMLTLESICCSSYQKCISVLKIQYLSKIIIEIHNLISFASFKLGFTFSEI